LLCVSGLSPQVVTETLYALAVKEDPPFVPHEIHLLTTNEGARSAMLGLLDEHEGHFRHLCLEYGIDAAAIRFGPDTIHLIRDPAGQALDDIRTEQDNMTAADTITALVRRLMADPHCRVHASIAGGRKTMGFFLAYAMSLFGRPQDRISHVLVSPPFEGHPDFYYPPRKPVLLKTPHEHRLFSTADARITLADIPFVRLRDGLPRALREGVSSFSETIVEAQRAMLPVMLVIDLKTRTVTAGGHSFQLSLADFATYSWFALRRANGEEPVRWTDPGLAESFVSHYERVAGKDVGNAERVRHALKGGMSEEYLEQRKSKTNRALRKCLGELAAGPYLIGSFGQKPLCRSGLTLPDDAVTLRGFANGNAQNGN